MSLMKESGRAVGQAGHALAQDGGDMELNQSNGLGQIARVIEQARSHLRQSVNHAMVASYWEIGRLIVEHEQQGQARAAYGQQQLAEVSTRLTALFGKGFDVSNLRTMRRFYQAFPIRDAVRLELGWTHYRALVRVETAAIAVAIDRGAKA